MRLVHNRRSNTWWGLGTMLGAAALDEKEARVVLPKIARTYHFRSKGEWCPTSPCYGLFVQLQRTAIALSCAHSRTHAFVHTRMRSRTRAHTLEKHTRMRHQVGHSQSQTFITSLSEHSLHQKNNNNDSSSSSNNNKINFKAKTTTTKQKKNRTSKCNDDKIKILYLFSIAV